MVSSDTGLRRGRRNIGLWNNPVIYHSRVAPSPLLGKQARYQLANHAVAGTEFEGSRRSAHYTSVADHPSR